MVEHHLELTEYLCPGGRVLLVCVAAMAVVDRSLSLGIQGDGKAESRSSLRICVLQKRVMNSDQNKALNSAGDQSAGLGGCCDWRYLAQLHSALIPT